MHKDKETKSPTELNSTAKQGDGDTKQKTENSPIDTLIVETEQVKSNDYVTDTSKNFTKDQVLNDENAIEATFKPTSKIANFIAKVVANCKRILKKILLFILIIFLLVVIVFASWNYFSNQQRLNRIQTFLNENNLSGTNSISTNNYTNQKKSSLPVTSSTSNSQQTEDKIKDRTIKHEFKQQQETTAKPELNYSEQTQLLTIENIDSSQNGVGEINKILAEKPSGANANIEVVATNPSTNKANVLETTANKTLQIDNYENNQSLTNNFQQSLNKSTEVDNSNFDNEEKELLLQQIQTMQQHIITLSGKIENLPQNTIATNQVTDSDNIRLKIEEFIAIKSKLAKLQAQQQHAKLVNLELLLQNTHLAQTLVLNLQTSTALTLLKIQNEQVAQIIDNETQQQLTTLINQLETNPKIDKNHILSILKNSQQQLKISNKQPFKDAQQYSLQENTLNFQNDKTSSTFTKFLQYLIQIISSSFHITKLSNNDVTDNSVDVYFNRVRQALATNDIDKFKQNIMHILNMYPTNANTLNNYQQLETLLSIKSFVANTEFSTLIEILQKNIDDLKG